MKGIFLIILLCVSCLTSNAQRYIRYHMNDGSFYGFNTGNVPYIDHYTENGDNYTSVWVGEKNYVIPVDKIDSISFEGCSAGDDDFIGKYRIYELDYDNDDLNFKKVIVDNRAMLLASKNGDFGANDTILFSSIFNNTYCLFITNSKGYISKVFNGESFFYFDWEDENNANIIKLTNDGYEVIQKSSQYIHDKIIKVPSVIDNLFFKHLGDLSNNENEILGFLLGQANNSYGDFFKSIEEIRNNPELKNQILVVDGLIIAGDIAGIVASVAGGVPTGGFSLFFLGASISSLFNDIISTINDVWPDSEQMERYKNYYQNKYSINLSTLPEEDVTYNSAKLNGTFTSTNGIKGEFYFDLIGTDVNRSTTATAEKVTDKSFLLSGNATGLKPGEIYIYTVKYKCIIDGMEIILESNNQEDFMTKYPSAYTGDVSNIEEDYAEITCTYYDVPDGGICGVEYSWDGGTSRQTAQSNEEGEKIVRLTSLKPNTEYTCTAFVEFDGMIVYAENSTSFKTQPEKIELPDLSGTWVFDQDYFGEKSLTVTLELQNSSATSATYKAKSGFYGVNSMTVTVNIDKTGIIHCASPYGGSGDFSGTFNDTFTNLSGDSYYYGTGSWTFPGFTVESSWSLHR